jgi:type II secretory pathway predicted ATPase ExeA
MNPKLLALYGLKFNPFRPDLPPDALFISPTIDAFCRRIEFGLADGGFAMVTGDPGTGKSIALRLLQERLRARQDLVVATIERPVGRASDFYRELGDLFNVPLFGHNRWSGFKGLRARWSEHIETSLMRPVLIIDEAQEMVSGVFTELRLLASKELDSRSLLSVVFAGDGRLPQRFRSDDLLPLGSRVRRRLKLEHASRDELTACIDHVLGAAGAPHLMTTELKSTLAEHAAGNYRVLMNLADELLTVAAERDLARLDEKLFIETFAQSAPPRSQGKKR